LYCIYYVLLPFCGELKLLNVTFEWILHSRESTVVRTLLMSKAAAAAAAVDDIANVTNNYHCRRWVFSSAPNDVDAGVYLETGITRKRCLYSLQHQLSGSIRHSRSTARYIEFHHRRIQDFRIGSWSKCTQSKISHEL